MTTLPPDPRGTISTVTVQGQRVNVLYSKRGTWRGGDYHPVKQYNVLLSGRVEITYKRPYGLYGAYEQTTVLLPGEMFITQPEWAHLFYFREDSVMLEWWDGAFQAAYYQPYRDIVEAHLRGAQKS